MISFQDIISLAEEVGRTSDFILSWYAFFVFVLGLGLSSLIELVLVPVIHFLLFLGKRFARWLCFRLAKKDLPKQAP